LVSQRVDAKVGQMVVQKDGSLADRMADHLVVMKVGQME
jgi:hypothetical protein